MFTVEQITEVVEGRLVSGKPAARAKGVSADSRTIKAGQLFIPIKGEHFDGHNFIPEAVKKGAAAVIFDRARFGLTQIPAGLRKRASFIEASNTRSALGSLACFNRSRFDIPVIAVTGSNGKTTVKDMIAWTLSSLGKVLKNTGTENNDIGLPLTLLRLDSSYDIAVLELGTNNFGEIAYLTDISKPNAGVITNIGPTHLEKLQNLAGVYREKMCLLDDLHSPAISILNIDNPLLEKSPGHKKNFTITYGIKNRGDFFARQIRINPKNKIEFVVNANSAINGPAACRKIELNTLGFINVYNALAAIAIARIFGCSYNIIIRRFKSFVFPPGRLHFKKFNGVSFIDDTYNANPVSLSEAFAVIDRYKVKGRKILIMGDMLELGKSAKNFHYQAGDEIAGIFDIFIGVGRFTALAAQRAIKSGLNKRHVFSCQDSQEAGRLLFSFIKPTPGDLILVKGSRLMKMEGVFNNKF